MYFNKFSFKLLSCLISVVHKFLHKRSYTSLQNFNLNILLPQPRIIFHGCFFDYELWLFPFFSLSNSSFPKFARNLFIINWDSFVPSMKFSHKSNQNQVVTNVLYTKFRIKYNVKELIQIKTHIIFNWQIIWIKNLKKKNIFYHPFEWSIARSIDFGIIYKTTLYLRNFKHFNLARFIRRGDSWSTIKGERSWRET